MLVEIKSPAFKTQGQERPPIVFKPGFNVVLGEDGAITPHVCRHTCCSNQAKAGMDPKTLQYLMGHSDFGVTLSTYTHLGLEDAAEELRRMK